jgi:hypothetical protein
MAGIMKATGASPSRYISDDMKIYSNIETKAIEGRNTKNKYYLCK